MPVGHTSLMALSLGHPRVRAKLVSCQQQRTIQAFVDKD